MDLVDRRQSEFSSDSAQTNAFSLSASRNFQPDEWIKNAVLVLCRNTGAIIVDFDANSGRCC